LLLLPLKRHFKRTASFFNLTASFTLLRSHFFFFSTLHVGDGFDFSGDPLLKPSPDTPGQFFPNPVEDPAFCVFVQGYAGVIFCDLPSKNVSHPLVSKVPATHVQNALGKPLSMASDACSSNTRRGIGGAGGQQELRSGNATSSSLQPQDVTEAHCKFFLWVDDHIVRVRAGEATRGSGDGKQSDVGKHLGMDNLIDHVEERIAKLEKLLNKKSREAELRKKAREAAARDMEASSTTDVAVEVECKLEFVHGVLMAYCRYYQVFPCTGLGSVIVQQSSGVYNCSPKTQGHH
ncbi:hypothetical protein S245_058014, partial [Arachis hypogaea]